MPKELYTTIQYCFTKPHPKVYFDLLRLAKVSDCAFLSNTDKTGAINALTRLPSFTNTHKRLLPLLNNKAHRLNIFSSLPQDIQNTLQSTTRQGVVTELARIKQLDGIVSVLAKLNIPIILLKGAAFAGTLYSANAPRTSNDLDILIQQQHWQHAVAAIKSLMNYTQKPQPDVFGDLYELSFLPRTATGAALDLHSALIHPLLFTIDENDLWQSSTMHPQYNNELVRMLSPEHSLIHQAIHGYKDMNFAKYNLVDSCEILFQQQPSLAKTIRIAKQWGAGIPLFVLLQNCKDVMQVDIDETSLEQLHPSPIRQKLLTELLKSHFTQPLSHKKSLRYRLNQIIGQFVFTGSIKKPLALQRLFIRSMWQNKIGIE